ncbi:hypothetical protein Q7C36_023070 [Tachysurus vachellii]|uniref:Ropporin-1-like protein n=1 Tax=Tachysurus vachellii TaxID=175792 RepID=A0AA88IIW9_TACVA|nr:ropporin-1-like protein [Tachysurus vachellii]XP_060718317.1 ropporin-1-like protein [Tachysurus vachellii]XP_060718318.1 ropporin-1-like protein [Tachysurus vachellii]XP_060718319.1 ropporin-1-like protein [Tachysurus vachellii]KAK2814804.1 hypothetical protein Q7C36_023070 [Tachysurus vachellii]
MPLSDRIYCAQQINIPPDLPDILKQFTKAAIRTQPPDVLQWSADYFTALSEGEPLPVKDRLEIFAKTPNTDNTLTPGLLKVLHEQLSSEESVSREKLVQKWTDLRLPAEQLDTLLSLGNFSTQVHWMHFVALGCSALGGTIISALKFACEILSDDPEGGEARIPFDTFVSLYRYLAELDGDIPQDEIDRFLFRLHEPVTQRGGMVQPADFSDLHV